MADSDAGRYETYRNGSVTADIVQQGSRNAGRDINNARRDVNNSMSFLNTFATHS
jgi:hypothetical protein